MSGSLRTVTLMLAIASIANKPNCFMKPSLPDLALTRYHARTNLSANDSKASHVPWRHPADRIGDAAVPSLERVDALHLLVAEREVEYRNVLGQASGIRRARNWRNDLLLNEPAQRNLRNGPVLCARDLAKHWVLEQSAAPERAIGGVDEPARAAGVEQRGLVEIGMVLGLQRHQRLRAERNRLVEQCDVEIGNTHVACEALPLGLSQRTHRLG